MARLPGRAACRAARSGWPTGQTLPERRCRAVPRTAVGHDRAPVGQPTDVVDLEADLGPGPHQGELAALRRVAISAAVVVDETDRDDVDRVAVPASDAPHGGRPQGRPRSVLLRVVPARHPPSRSPRRSPRPRERHLSRSRPRPRRRLRRRGPSIRPRRRGTKSRPHQSDRPVSLPKPPRALEIHNAATPIRTSNKDQYMSLRNRLLPRNAPSGPRSPGTHRRPTDDRREHPAPAAAAAELISTSKWPQSVDPDSGAGRVRHGGACLSAHARTRRAGPSERAGYPGDLTRGRTGRRLCRARPASHDGEPRPRAGRVAVMVDPTVP